jgi:uracil-DNA glycosylase
VKRIPSSSPPASSAPNEALARLAGRVARCRLCPRLVAHRERVAREKVARFRDWTYWGRPVPGFGDPDARVLIVGLAPAAHGGNRTGRIFTGDESGNWLYASLHGAGFANQPTSTHRDDGLRLRDAYVSAVARCAPPANRPTPTERDTCAPWFDRELGLVLPSLAAIVALGSFAWAAALAALARCDVAVPRPRPAFSHGTELRVGGSSRGLLVLGCYHPSQQNTFTGRLTEPMLDDVFARANAA